MKVTLSRFLPSLRRARGLSWVVLLCFLLSGASGLIYQVVWLRILTLVFGATSFATSTVLTAFMAGLALGSIYAGRRVDRLKRPLLAYILIEAAVGVYGLLLLLILPALSPVYGLIWRQFNVSFVILSLVRFLLVGAVLLPPTFLMGATLPVLAAFYARSRDRLAMSVGTLYAINTSGAVLGAALSGFWLLPAFGITRTVVVAAGLNLGLAGLALIPLRRVDPDHEAPPAEAEPARKANRAAKPAPSDSLREEVTPRAVRGTLVAFAISGFLALTYEVVWTRMLSLVVGSSVYAFSIMLTTFLTGLALGGFLASRLADRLRRPLLCLGCLQVGVGLSALAGLWLFPELPYWFIQLHKRLSYSHTGLLYSTRFLISGLIILVPTALLGAVLPLVIGIIKSHRWSVGRLVGDAYTVNTVGAIAGAFVAGFVLIPALGMRNTLSAAAAANLLLGSFLLLLRGGPARRRLPFALAPILLLLALIWRPVWDPAIIASGVYRYAPSYASLDRAKFRQELAGSSNLLFYEEGLTATVTVQRQQDFLVLKVNGKPDATTAGDLPTQVLVGLIPLVMRDQTERALVVGMGSGVTAGAVLQTPVREVTLVELERAVVTASSLFEQYNYRPLDDRRLRLEVNDGRNYLAVSREQFDVIISEPSNPWITGVSNLFTLDYFQLGARRLRPGGLFCQWLQIYEMPVEDVKVLLRTFNRVFPYIYLFRTTDGDLVLVGSFEEQKLDLGRLGEKFRDPRTAAALAQVEIKTPADLFARLYLGPKEVAAYAGPGLINTDDNAYIEFQAPKRVGLGEETTVPENEAALKAARRDRTQYLAAAGADAAALATFFADLSMSQVKQEDLDSALTSARRSVERHETARGYSILGEIHLAKGDEAGAFKSWTRAVELDPHHFNTLINFGKYHLGRNEFAAALGWVDRALKLDGGSARAHHLKALGLEGVSEQRGDREGLAAALDEYALAVRDEQYTQAVPRFYFHYGVALRKYGMYENAARRLEKYVSLQPNDYEGHYELGYACQILGERLDSPALLERALAAYRDTISLKADFARAHYWLSQVLRRLDRIPEAEQAFNTYQSLRGQQKF